MFSTEKATQPNTTSLEDARPIASRAELEQALNHKATSKSLKFPSAFSNELSLHYSKAFPWVRTLPIDPSSVSLSSEDLWVPHSAQGDSVTLFREQLKFTLSNFISSQSISLPAHIISYRFHGCMHNFYRDFAAIIPDGEGAPRTLVAIRGANKSQRSIHRNYLQESLAIGRLQWPNLQAVLVVISDRPQEGTSLLTPLQLIDWLKAETFSSEVPSVLMVDREPITALALKNETFESQEVPFERVIHQRHIKHSLNHQPPRRALDSKDSL